MMRTSAIFLIVLIAASLACAKEPQAPAFTVETPKGECWVIPGDILDVLVKGETGWTLTFSLGTARTDFPLIERTAGCYAASVPVRSTDTIRDEKIIVSATDAAGKTLKIISRGTVTLLSEMTVGSVGRKDTLLRTGPDDNFDRRHPLQPGARLLITGLSNGYYRVLLGEGQTAWTPRDGLALCPPGTAPTRPLLTSVQCRSNETSAEAALTLSEPAAFDLREHGDLRGLDIILYGTSLAVDNIIHPGNIEFIQSVSPEQESPGRAVLHLYLDGRLAGFEGKTDGRILTVRFSRPCLTLKGARVIIDPGHGGKDSGAVGAGGLAEKDVNLKVGLRLRDLLEAKGAAVVMTRRTDTEVSATRERRSELEARVEAAAAASGAIYVSIHHNAMPDVNDGRKAHGTDIYYWRLQSAPLARAVAAPLAASVREDKARFLRRSFHVIRQTAMPAILVEVQFISNPVMEEMMKSDSYVNEAAAGILKGIENYFSEIPNPAAGSSARPADGH